MNNTQLALCDTRGPLTDLLQKLSGDDGAQWLYSFKRFLRHEDPWVVFQTYANVLVGGLGLDAATRYINLMRGRGHLRTEDCVTLRMLGKIVCRSEVFRFNLVRVSPWELGFRDDAPTYNEICERAAEFDLVLCEHEVAPVLRATFYDDKPTETSCIATSTIFDPNDLKPRIFMIECFGAKRFLGNRICNTDSRFLPGEKFIFAKKE